MKAKLFAGLVVLALIAVLDGSAPFDRKARAQPLVTGDLSIYYNFDHFFDYVLDKTGNGIHAKIQDRNRALLDTGRTLATSGVITNDHTNPRRGFGAIRFAQSGVPGEDPVFLDMHGSVIAANAPAKVPSSAVTVAAWLNLDVLGGPNEQNGPGSILQMASAGPSYVMHYQIEGGGQIRVALRGQLQAQNIVSSGGAPYSGHPYPNQPEIDASGSDPVPFPIHEWHHTAFTYDKNANGGVGEFAIYFDGVKIRSGPPNGLTNGVPTGPIDMGTWGLRSATDFYDGLGIGAVMDSGLRRLHGMMDEFYLFTRALSPAEINILAHPELIPEPTSCGLLLMALGTVCRSMRCRRRH